MSFNRKKAKRAVKVTADTTAALIGNILRVVLKSIAAVLLIFFTTGLLFTCIFAYYVKHSLAQDLDVDPKEFAMSMTSTIWYTDSNGKNHELVTLDAITTEKRIWVDYENIPIYMEEAAVAIEDHRFYEHRGVDWYRTVAAFANMFVSMKNDFGGSTITQQLLKNITGEDDITVQRKLLEIFRALEFEKKYTKEEIIELYLNAVYFGESCYGVQAASQVYFDKNVWELTPAECACIVGITNNPSLYDPYISQENNQKRQRTILHQMYRYGYLTYDEYVEAVNQPLEFKRAEGEERETEIYSYYVETVIKDVVSDFAKMRGINYRTAYTLFASGGYQVYCCLDTNIQSIIDEQYKNWDNMPYVGGGTLQSAIVIMDPYTGKIVGLSGGIGEKNGNFILNRVESKRPPGSSFKPIATYGPAYDLGLITQYTTVNDAPKIKLSGTTWYPSNSGGGNRGVTTIRDALRSSLNTVSAQILDKLGIEASVDYLENHLGVTSLIEADHDYAPLSLGQLTNGITVREMCQAYCAFVNDGTFTYSRTYTHVTDFDGNMVMDNQPKTIQAFQPNTAHNMADMLKNAATYGTGSEANLGIMPTAGKTGTTSDDRDRYFVGFTPYYVAAVWTGFDQPARMFASGNPACQIWKKVMLKVHQGLEYRNFPTPVIGAPTKIFGDMQVEESEEPSDEPSDEPSEEPTESPSPTPTDGEQPTETPSVPTATVTVPPITTNPPTIPPIVTDPPPVTEPPVVTPPVVEPPTDIPVQTIPPVIDPPPAVQEVGRAA